MRANVGLALAFLAFVAPFAHAEVIRDERVKMTSPMSITIDAPAERTADAHAVIDVAYDEVDRLAALLSEWSPASDVSRVNAAAGSGTPVTVARETYEVVAAAVEVGRLTEGAFDITFLPIGRCWNFKQKPPALPDANALARAMALVDYRRIQLDSKALTIALPDSGMGIGLGGIAQGYIADRAADLIRAQGFANFMVDVSGDLRVNGMIEGRPWRVGIKHPRLAGRTVATVPIANGLSISTAGDYEKFFELGGRRYHHIIDPKTGYPAPGCQSVTVVSLDTMLTDGLDTGLFVMGPERGIALAEKLPDVEAMIVDANGIVHTTSGFQLAADAAAPLTE